MPTDRKTLFEESKKFVDAKIKERITNAADGSKNPPLWKEFPGVSQAPDANGSVPLDIQMTSKVDQLADYYIENETKLSNEVKDYLKARIGTVLYLNELQEAQQKKATTQTFGLKTDAQKDEISLTGIEGKYQRQTTVNGCWSCAYAMLLESRGISLNQQIIRSFRPDLKEEDLKNLKDTQKIEGLVSDAKFSPFEVADLTSKVLPGTAMRQVMLQGWRVQDEKDSNATKTDPAKKDAAKAALKAYIKEALQEHHSPIAINGSGHYYTVVGIEGDNLKVLNSSNGNAGVVDTKQVDDFLGDLGSVSLTWLQDLKLTKEGKLQQPLKGFDQIKYDKGIITEKGEDKDFLNKSGKTFVTVKESPVTIQDSIYVPEQVPQAFYAMEEATEKEKTGLVRQAILDAIQTAFSEMQDVANAAYHMYDANTAANPAKPEQTNQTKEQTNQSKEQTNQTKEQKTQTKEQTVQTKEETFQTKEEAFRYALAELVTLQNHLVAYDRSKEPDKDRIFLKKLQDRSDVKKLAESRTFADFCKEMDTKKVLALCEAKPEARLAAVADLHNDFMAFQKELKITKAESMQFLSKKPQPKKERRNTMSAIKKDKHGLTIV